MGAHGVHPHASHSGAGHMSVAGGDARVSDRGGAERRRHVGQGDMCGEQGSRISWRSRGGGGRGGGAIAFGATRRISRFIAGFLGRPFRDVSSAGGALSLAVALRSEPPPPHPHPVGGGCGRPPPARNAQRKEGACSPGSRRGGGRAPRAPPVVRPEPPTSLSLSLPSLSPSWWRWGWGHRLTRNSTSTSTTAMRAGDTVSRIVGADAVAHVRHALRVHCVTLRDTA